ncbi:uncharacterized protein GGS22DRAFT_150023 [Annulohypoxylon maeteangense]|uniref:uncharacterized protein n=1 Tax=Annulohypoxylon maeteangense TaxID=1927788 RepID=UPI0020083F6E|nr:uncharacterized protein GGS22DRAFT_150023 [Annulohypoxylon maeteangense]KAI0890111.1 hypothetical protein GGS22DRAFT_150023 [Annulohypoxylon maeteangense]
MVISFVFRLFLFFWFLKRRLLLTMAKYSKEPKNLSPRTDDQPKKRMEGRSVGEFDVNGMGKGDQSKQIIHRGRDK